MVDLKQEETEFDTISKFGYFDQIKNNDNKISTFLTEMTDLIFWLVTRWAHRRCARFRGGTHAAGTGEVNIAYILYNIVQLAAL